MNELYLLIRSLKNSEKRYFTLSCHTMVASKKSNYARLFEVLDGLTAYDEKAILLKYRKEPFAKNYAANKAYLYEMILASLRNYQEDSIEEWGIRRNFYKIKILASKGLDKQCEKLIIKTKAKAWQYEQYQTLLDILDVELYLFGNCRIGEMSKDLFWNLKSEKDTVIKILTEYNQVQSAWHQINLLFANKLNEPFIEIQKQAERIINSLALLNEPSPTHSLTVRNRYYACFELYYNHIGNAKLCYTYNKQLIDNRALIDIKMPNIAVDAMAVYFNYMVACYKYQQWEQMEVYLYKTLHYPTQSIEQQIRRTHNYCYNGMLLFLHTQQLDKAKDVVAIFEQAKANFGEQYRVDFLLFTQAHVGWYYFLQNNIDKATTLWREILQGPKYTVETRTQATTRFYLLIVYYLQKEEQLFHSELTNTKRYVKQHFLLGKSEALFLDTMAALQHNKSDTALFKTLTEKLCKVVTTLTEKSVLNQFIINWLANRVN